MTFYEAHKAAVAKLSVDGDRTARIDMPGGGYVKASLYDGEEEARDALGRDMLGKINAAYTRDKA